MKANELRIGNLVIYKWFDKNYVSGKQRTIIHREIVKVLAIDSVNNRVLIKTNQTRKNQTWVNISVISSVPLTEEILLKCGFEKNCYGFKKGRLTFRFRDDGKIVPNIYDIELLEINHLHQIQNLYYALTQQELQVNL